MLSALGTLNAQQYFHSFAGLKAPSKGTQYLIPETYKLYTASNSELKQYLHLLDSDPNSKQIITLPQPHGSNRSFRIWKSSMLEEPLQSTFPDIETFSAVALDNANVTAKLDFTLSGFHAMVFDGEQTYLIDPYTDAADGYYLVYYKKDYRRSVNSYMSCAVGTAVKAEGQGNTVETADGTLPRLGAKQFGNTKRVYRLALSCTGEYAAAVGGAIPTKASVLSAMVTSMNRVNGIYEREVGVKMQLIGNNDTLIYLNSNTDPFSNTDGDALLTQNSNNTGTIIGAANYDIGHVFSTGGGGIAWVGCVCKSQGNLKARGVTGSANPVGDAYDVDYVAHEMGHQFGGDHTFNKCSGTEDVNAAYEPGGGTTIMAYAGICGTNNIQSHSDDYFHIKSLDQISTYLVDQGTCAQISVGLNTPVLPEIEDTFFVPYKTPFELSAPVATPELVKYSWEQWDLGDFQSNNANSGSFIFGPSFRSFYSDTDRVRVFPIIDSLVKNTTMYKGEKLPQVARMLHFKACARNLVNGYGGFDFSENELTLNVINTGVPFEVTFPDASVVSVKAGSTMTVTWNIAQTDIPPISTPNIDIFLSIDGGFTYPYKLAAAVPNNGLYDVTIPDTLIANKARIKVKGSGNVFFNISKKDFEIYSGELAVNNVELDNNVTVYPNPTADFIHVLNKSNHVLNIGLYNVIGQRIWMGSMKQTISIPVGRVSKGIYYLQLTDGNSGAKAVKPITVQ